MLWLPELPELGVGLGLLGCDSSATQAGALSPPPPGPSGLCPTPPGPSGLCPPPGSLGAVPVPQPAPARGVGSAREGRLLPGLRLGAAPAGRQRQGQGIKGFPWITPCCSQGVPLNVACAFGIGKRTCLALKLCPRSQPVDRASIFLLHVEGTNP